MNDAIFYLATDGALRPPIRSEAVDRLYWVGGGVHPGSGLMTILEAAKNAARFVTADLLGGAGASK